MNCKRMQELIITNYLDNELDEGRRREIEAHLRLCAECRQFEKAVKQTAIEPFRDAVKNKPPESLWYQIKKRIEAEEAKPALVNVRESFGSIFRVRKPAFALATVMTILLIALVITKAPFNGQAAVNTYLDEQAEFLSYLDEISASDMDFIDLGTNIEEYFL